ncbi:MAG: carboxypeptidase regulatory-like domain-containing protein [Acidobacteria bacterium]|nr:MAG: carboxypeptidase regulatory-like domain-containing protein [Acidobacteriota bacterium]
MKRWMLSPALFLALAATGNAGAQESVVPATPASALAAEIAAAPSPPPLAGGRGRIKGTVSGSGRSRLTAARVMARVALDDRDIIYLTTTDHSGTYYFENLPAGIFVLEALAEGMATGRYDDVRVRPPFRSILDFRLVPGDTTAATATPAVEVPDSANPVMDVVQVRGLVLAEGDMPLPDAEIAFAGGPPPGHRLVLSRQNGRLFLPDLPAALYELRVTAPGTIPIRVPGVLVRPGRPLELTIRLVDYPVEMAAQRGVILPPEEPLPPRRYLTIPAAPDPDPAASLPDDVPAQDPVPSAAPQDPAASPPDQALPPDPSASPADEVPTQDQALPEDPAPPPPAPVSPPSPAADPEAADDSARHSNPV